MKSAKARTHSLCSKPMSKGGSCARAAITAISVGSMMLAISSSSWETSTLDALRRQMRCEKCGKREFMNGEFWSPTGREWEGLIVRRLVGTRMIRKVIWRDELARR